MKSDESEAFVSNSPLLNGTALRTSGDNHVEPQWLMARGWLRGGLQFADCGNPELHYFIDL